MIETAILFYLLVGAGFALADFAEDTSTETYAVRTSLVALTIVMAPAAWALGTVQALIWKYTR